MLHVVFSQHYLRYNFGKGHPFTPKRWDALSELLRTIELQAEWVEPGDADDDEILALHALPFVEAVKSASAGHGALASWQFGLGSGDVPIFLGMHEATQSVCGGSIEAARRILSSAASRVLQLGGGLHHAMPGRAAGFCVYNDVAMAINEFVNAGKRVAFLDIDVHHSDGVQEMFYNEPTVLNISLHQSGHTLFPGTGFTSERGGPEAPGSVINLPLEPGTRDENYLACFDAIVPMAIAEFGADVLVVEVGADAHFRDPLAQIELTTTAYQGLFDRIVRIADDSCGGQLLATLGGGYGFDATLRIWTMLAHRLAEQSLPDQLPEDWRSKWQEATRLQIAPGLSDHEAMFSSGDRSLTNRRNLETVDVLNRLLG